MDKLKKVLTKIVEENGKDILSNDLLFKLLFSDNWKFETTEEKWQGNLCIQLIKEGFVKQIIENNSFSEKEKQVLLEKLENEYCINKNKASIVLDALQQALFGDKVEGYDLHILEDTSFADNNSEDISSNNIISSLIENQKHINYEKISISEVQKLAEEGNVEAQCSLGDCYYNGEGVSINYEKAVKWYRKAAEQGVAYAQFSLGVCCYNGEGVPLNYEKAFEWYQKSAEQGVDYAQFALGECYYNGEGVALSYEKAVEWYQKSAEQGNPDAMNSLGICYLNGEGVPQNYEKAVEWYQKAEEQSNTDTKQMLILTQKNIKIKDGFLLKEVAGNFVVVPGGTNIVDFSAMITINETGAFLWECLQNETNIEELVLKLTMEYDIDEETARKDTEEFLKILQENYVI